MPSPFTWDITKPAGGDALSIGDDQIRTDKTSLRDVLRTLVPFGTPTTGWRVVQINNDIYMVHNAKYDGTNWSHDDTSVDAKGVRIPAAGGLVETIFRAAAGSTWTTWLVGFEVAMLASMVNRLQALAATTGNPAQVLAAGSDTDIDILLTPKGAGRGRGAENIWGAGSIGQLAADNTTRYMAPTGMDTPGTVENDHLVVIARALTVQKIQVQLDNAPNGATKTRTFTLRKDGVDTALAVTYTDAESGAKTDTDAIAFTPGQVMSWSCAAANTPDVSRVQMGISFRTT